MGTRMRAMWIAGVAAASTIVSGHFIRAQGSSPEALHFAYDENVGWMDFRPSTALPVTVTDGAVTGFAYGENIGWINFNPPFGGVTDDGLGNLAGYAWSENVGWISFSCRNTASCGRVDYGVRITNSGKFAGHAWGENIGWIRFDSSGNVSFGVETPWRPRDVTPPTIACPSDLVVSTDPGLATAVVAYQAPTATDDGSSVSVATTPASGSAFALGVTTVTSTATDAAGNTASCSFSVRVNDTEPPVITRPADVVAEATSPAGAVVPDGALGTATVTDNAPGATVARIGVPSGNQFPLGMTAISYVATDAAGNTATSTQGVTVRDSTPAVITIAVPIAGSYTLGQAVAASYTCFDSVSPVVTCAGSVPNGAALDTSAGTHTLTVTATDGTGNSSSKSVSYAVSYGVCLLYEPALARKAGSTIPIKLQLCDASGHNLSSVGISLHAVDVFKLSNQASTEVEDAGNANPDTDFRFDAASGGFGGYIFNLKTTGLTTGTYVLRFRVSGDAVLHGSEALFQVR